MSTATKPKEIIITFPFYLTAYHHAIKAGLKRYKLTRKATKEGWEWELSYQKETQK